MFRKILVGSGGALLCAASLFVGSCSLKGQAEQRQPEHPANQPAAPVVAAARVGREDLSQKLTLAADFKPYQEIDLHAKVAGYVREIRVDVGDQVRLGQVIAALEIPEFQSDLTQAAASRKRSESDVLRARSEVQRAKSIYDAAKLTYTRLDAVGKAKPNLLAQQEVDDAFAKLQVAEAQLNSAQAALAVTEEQVHVQEASESRVKTLAAYSTITAPFSGLITKRYADRGAMIQAGTASQTQAMPVVRLSQVDHLRLILPVPESAVPRVQVGRSVAVKVAALNQTFEGRVARFTGKVDPATRTMETEVDVPNPRLLLKPGMYGSAEIELEHRPAAVTVPVQAVIHQDNKTVVMLVNAQHRIEAREIVIGLETPQSVEVTSGLNDGDIVLIGNPGQLKAGQLVEPKITQLGGEAKASGQATTKSQDEAKGGRR